MIPDYSYRVQDHSIVTPGFKKYIVEPLFRFVPWWIPANVITIFSNSCLYIALIIALNSKPDQRFSYFASAILIFFYAVGDHFDGMQAKTTNTSSALGEFFDHFLDTFNTGIVLMILFALYGFTNPYYAALILSVNYLAHASIFYEQFKTGWLIFEKIGSLEALLFTSVLLLFSCFTPINHFLLYMPWHNIRIIDWIIFASSAGTLITFFKTIVRARIKEFRFYIFCMLVIFTSWVCMEIYSAFTISLILTLYSGYYIGNLIRGHLSDGKERLPDLVVPVMLAFTGFSSLFDIIDAKNIILVFLSVSITYIAYSVIYNLREFWVWKNPK